MAKKPKEETQELTVKEDRRFYLEEGDNNKYIRHVMSNMNLSPIDISDAKQVEDRIQWYFNHCMEDDLKPTVGGLCNSLGIHRDTLNQWKNGEYRNSTHTDIIKKAYNILDELWEHYMMNGKINPVTGIYLGKVMFGHIEEQHIVLQPKTLDSDYQDASTIEAKYKQLPSD